MVGEITMIDRAAEKIRALLAGAKEEHGLRIAKLAQPVKKFLADLRTNYQARKKNKLPMEKKQRRFSIGYFIFSRDGH